MTQFNLDNPIVASTKSGTQLASDLSNWRNAVHTSHAGSVQPSYRQAGMIWTDTTTSTMHILKYYDGAAWSIIGYINTTLDVFIPAGQNPRYNYIVTTGTQPAYVLTLSPAMTAYGDQTVVSVEIHATNTGAATLNVNALGAKALRKIVSGADVALAASDLLIKNRYTFSYDAAANAGAGAFVLVTPTVDLPSLPGIITDVQLPDRLNGSATTNPYTNANNANLNGWWSGAAGVAGNPDASYSYVMHVVRWSSSYIVQDAFNVNVFTHYRRQMIGGSWGAWVRIYDSSGEVQSLVDNALVVLAAGAVATYADAVDSSIANVVQGGNVAGSTLFWAGILSGSMAADQIEEGQLTYGGGGLAGSWNRRNRTNSHPGNNWVRGGLCFRYA